MAFVNSQIKHATIGMQLRRTQSRFGHGFPAGSGLTVSPIGKDMISLLTTGVDPEDYAYAKFGQALHHLLSGGSTDFQNTNFPPGHKFRSWTIDEVKEEMAAGVDIEQALDGDWS